MKSTEAYRPPPLAGVFFSSQQLFIRAFVQWPVFFFLRCCSSLQDTKISEIMRPRVEVVAIEANSTMMDLYTLHQVRIHRIGCPCAWIWCG